MCGPEHDPGDRDGREVLEELGIRSRPHRGAGLRAEVLDDDLLHVAVLGVEVAEGDERLGAVADALADPDEDSGRERDAGGPGVGDDLQAHGGVLVGRAVVRAARLVVDRARGRLEHHAHGRSGRAQVVQLRRRHDAGVEVREQPGLGRDQPGGMADVVERRGEAVLVEPRARFGPAVLGPVAEGQQRLFAAAVPPCAGDEQDLLVRHVERRALEPQLPGGVDEDAVVAAIAAQRRERHEHLARVRDRARPPGGVEPFVAQRRGTGEESIEVGAREREQALGLVDGDSGIDGSRDVRHDGQPRSERRGEGFVVDREGLRDFVVGDDARRHDVDAVVGDEGQQAAGEQLALDLADPGGGKRLARRRDRRRARAPRRRLRRAPRRSPRAARRARADPGRSPRRRPAARCRRCPRPPSHRARRRSRRPRAGARCR